ncbi:2'-5' RNA ligase family protein [Agromyces sp. H66]|uniref:2'-5' RNA ligase family protein n=1 Tax=Agromyces sp. H66 TaxID=2529859 RepID=UPI0010AA1DAF|nr:2'-5' RNA ligase family protein [Agromyces sp. H66]
MARFVLVLPLEPLVVNDEFTVAQWPLHLTLVEPFETDVEVETLNAALAPVAAGAQAIPVDIGEDAMFGPRKNILVSLVRDDGRALLALRAVSAAALRDRAVDLGHIREDYRPHITAKQHGRVRQGDRLTLDTLALVRLRPPETSHHGRIVGSWRLGGSSAPDAAG